MSNKKRSLVADLFIGAIGGVIGTLLMDQASKAMYSLEDPKTQKYEETLRNDEYPPEVLAGKAIKLATGEQPAAEIKEKLAMPIHTGLGAAAGAVFGAVSRQISAPAVAAGIGFGVVLWAMLDEVGVPLAGLSPLSFKFPWQNHARALANHIVYGTVLGITQATIRKAL